METLEKVMLSAVAFLAVVLLRLLFREFREYDPQQATEEVLRRLFGRRKKDVAREPKLPTLSVPPAQGGRKGRLVSVFAEAAFDAPRKLAAWSAWVRDSSKTVQRTGMLEGHIHTRDHAALEALSKGIDLAVSEFGIGAGDSIVAQSASEHAVDVLSGRKVLRENRTDEAATLAAVKTALDGKGITLTAKHVHDPGGDINKRYRASVLAEGKAQRALATHLATSEAGEGRTKRA
ncbi:hypothetical protein [Azospirillum sp. SYSU D00513]|uniref:hypothetical protein n=1 Tax=Azospirillum sp. SYSU D00513 TaxID=2812561 RepID=UPI001A977C2E|nr:hypothetical protein [Azospirillum sp. SYSU D00513]